jgi:protein-disulfide isomerase
MTVTRIFSAAIALTVIFSALSAPSTLALTPEQEQQLMRQYQAKQDAERMEKELANPIKVEIDKDRAVSGDRKAPIVIVEFSDFQCPYCKKGYEIVEGLKKKYGKKLVVFFRNFPLDFHPNAMPAAKRFEAIALQSAKKAYEYHDKVFEKQDRLVAEGEKFLDEVAQGLKVNMKKMKTDMDGPKVKERIEKDMAMARELGITGTPGFIVSGVTLKGAYPQEQFEKVIDQRLLASDTKKR